MVCGFATVMVALSAPTRRRAHRLATLGRPRTVAAASRAGRRPRRRGRGRGRAGSSPSPAVSTGPISTRWPRSAGVHARRRGGAPDRAATDRGGHGVLARVRLPRRAARAAARRARGAPDRARSCRPGRWPSPTGTPPSTRRRRRVAGSWSAGPASPSSPGRARPTPCWRPGTGSASRWPVRASRRAASRWPRRRGRRPRARAPSSRSWRRGCGPSSRTAGAAASPRSASPARPGRSGLVRAGQPARRQRRRRRHAGDHRGRDPAALPRSVPRRRWSGAAPDVRVDGTPGARRARCCRWTPVRCSRSGRRAAAAAPTWRWPAASSGPSAFGSMRQRRVDAGSAPGPLGRGRDAPRRSVGAAAR